MNSNKSLLMVAASVAGMKPSSPGQTVDIVDGMARAMEAATPDEIARVVEFLVGDDATYCTGEVISPNGGAVL